jgi:predicted aspartyl protease
MRELTALGRSTVYTKCRIENPVERTRSVVIPKLLVDTGSEYTWVFERTLERIGIQREKKDIAFVLANGQEVTRNVGFAIIRLDKFFTIDEVVFAERGDLSLLGARTLEGLNLTIDPARKKLVAAGPLPDHREPASRRVGHSIRRKVVSGCEMRLPTSAEGVGP